MSIASERLKKDRQKIAQAFADAVEQRKHLKQNKPLYTLIVLCLIGTMLPVQAMTTFFSLTFVTSMLLSGLLLIKKQITFNQRKALTIGVLIATSVLSGCSPAFTFHTQPELIKFAHENDLEYHTISKFGIFGLGLDDATIGACQAESGIKNIVGTQVDRGHGLINVVMITVAGKT